MGMANKLAPSFKNLPNMTSIPVAMLTLHAFRSLEIVLIELFENLVYYD